MNGISIDFQRNEYLDYSEEEIPEIKKDEFYPQQALKSFNPILTEEQWVIDDKIERKKRSMKKKLLQKQKKEAYATKNFLPLFRYPHQRYIQKRFPQYKQISAVAEIFQKQGIAKRDYQVLYGQSELRAHWQQMFNNKILYRYMLLSRANIKQKKAFAKKIFRFEEAFLTKSFNRIK